MNSAFDLAGRGVVVTGGAGWLGRSMSVMLARHGADVIALGRSGDALTRLDADAAALGLGDSITTIQGDVAQDADLRQAIELADSKGEGLWGWVNNAASGRRTMLGHLDRADVERSLQGALVDAMMATERVAEHLASAGRGGSIVNVGSMYGRVAPDPRLYESATGYHNPPTYGAAKAGLAQFTRYCAVHYAVSGLRVNCVSPGPFPRPEVAQNDAFIRDLEQRVPLGRIGQPDELAVAVVFLIAPANSYMTGQDIAIDGGWTIW